MKQSQRPDNFLKGLYFFRGRVSLFALLKGMSIGKRDEVILQAFTCVANPEALMASGARPIYVDIEPNGVNMDPADLKKKITCKTKAIIIQHTFGIPADLDRICAIANENKIPVIEDCCHTISTQYKAKPVGSFGVGSYYSFEWGKPVVAGVGGALNIVNSDLRKKVEKQYIDYEEPSAFSDVRIFLQSIAHKILYRPRLYWPVRSAFHFLGSIGAAESNYNPIQVGKVAPDFSLKMSSGGRKRLKKKLTQIDQVTKHSKTITKEYAGRIDTASVAHLDVPDNCDIVFCRYPLLAKDKKELLVRARKANVELAEWYATPIHPLEGNDLNLVSYALGSCPEAEKRCEQIVTLPTHRTVNMRDCRRAVQFLNQAK